ncbi:MAG TPA: hypothetical protein DCW47_00005 [Lachnospiraceae bacterium]|nr:hypothetical protein [Lachnospiraceae bacterium]
MIEGNFHTHTPRCKHAEGSEREYIEEAIKKGFKTLGFSDHTPQPFKDGFVSSIRMDMDELDGYIETLLLLREEYRDRIDIKIGLEVEYYPSLFNELMREILKRPIEYIILGQHFVSEETDGFYAGIPTRSENKLHEYVELVTEGLKTGYFSYLAHPDLLNFTGEEDIYRREMTKLCEYCRDADIPLEVNMFGFTTRRHYPNERFFGLASGLGCRFVLGCDAHTPDALLQPEEIPGLMRLMENCRINYETGYGISRPSALQSARSAVNA